MILQICRLGSWSIESQAIAGCRRLVGHSTAWGAVPPPGHIKALVLRGVIEGSGLLDRNVEPSRSSCLRDGGTIGGRIQRFASDEAGR